MTYQSTVRRLTLVTAILVAIGLTLFLTAPFGKGISLAQASAENNPATGAPTISGTTQVGETLTADTSDIADEDGLDNVSFSYQWLSSRDTEIDGATTSTYTLVETDEGQTIKVRISFTDDADNQEMLTSAPTAAVAAPAQADSEDEPSELSYLTVVVTEDDSDPDNVVTTFTITWNDAEDCSASYNAYLDGVVGDPIHLGSAASEGEQIAASLTNVSAESIGFDAKLYCGTIGSGRLVDSLMIPEYSRSFDTVPISRAYLPKPGTYSTEPGLTVLTVSSGTFTPAFHSQTLNYTVPDVANADGRITLTTTTKADYYTVAFIPGSLYFYISSCSHGGQQTSVSYQDDTGNPLYPLTDADANTPGFQMELDEGENVFKIRVWPNCESGHVYKLTVTRAANAPANTPATGAPTIGGAAQVGETLTVDTSGIADADGLSGATFSYQWLSSRDTEIQGATDAAYILVPGDASKTIKVRVSFTDDEGNAETLTSAATGAVAPRPNSPATGAPTIGGTAQVGETLTVETSGIADADGLTGATFSYQWLGSRDAEIQGATNATYTLVTADEGKAIKVRVSFTDDAGNEEALTSEPTDAVSAAPPPPPDNVRAVTQESGAVELTWEAPQHATVTGYRIERSRADENRGGQQRSDGRPRDNHTLVEDTGSADTGYTDKSAEKGVEYEYRVSARNEAGAGESSEWVRAGPESASNSPTTGAPTISGTAQVGETLTAGITGIADADGLSGETFTYQWVSSDGTTDTDIEKATDSTYKLVDADHGKFVKVRVTFTDGVGNEETLTSAPTGPVFRDGPPGAPRNLIATAGNKEVTLSWEPPADNGNAPATRYRIEWRIDGKDYKKGHWGPSGETTYTKTDLANGVKYIFRVKAENGNGNSYGPYGPASEEVSATPTSGLGGGPGHAGAVEHEDPASRHGEAGLGGRRGRRLVCGPVLLRQRWGVAGPAHRRSGHRVPRFERGGEQPAWALVAEGSSDELCGRIGVVADRGVVRDQRIGLGGRARAGGGGGRRDRAMPRGPGHAGAFEHRDPASRHGEAGLGGHRGRRLVRGPVLPRQRRRVAGPARRRSGRRVPRFKRGGEQLAWALVAAGWCGQLRRGIGVVADRGVVRDQCIGLEGCARTRGGGGRRDRAMR